MTMNTCPPASYYLYDRTRNMNVINSGLTLAKLFQFAETTDDACVAAVSRP